MNNPLLELIKAYPDKPWNRSHLSENPWLTYRIISMDNPNWKGVWRCLGISSNINMDWDELLNHLDDISWFWFCRNNRFIGTHLEKLVKHPDTKYRLDWEKIHLNPHVTWETISKTLDTPHYYWGKNAILAHAPLKDLYDIINHVFRKTPLNTEYAQWFEDPITENNIWALEENTQLNAEFVQYCIRYGINPTNSFRNAFLGDVKKDTLIEAFNNYPNSYIGSQVYKWKKVADHPAIDPQKYIEHFGFIPDLMGNPRITREIIENFSDDTSWRRLSSNPFSRHPYYLGPKKEKRREIVAQILYRTDPPLLPSEICEIISSYL